MIDARPAACDDDRISDAGVRRSGRAARASSWCSRPTGATCSTIRGGTRAIPIRFHDEDASVGGDRRARPRAAPIDGVLAVGDRPTVIAARVAAGARAARAPARGRRIARATSSARASACATPACRCRGSCRRHRTPIPQRARARSRARIPVRPQAGGAVGQPRRHARRRSGGSSPRRSTGCARSCGRPTSAPSANEAHDPALVEGFIPGTRVRGGRRCCTTARSTCSRSSTSPIRSTVRSSRRPSTSRRRSAPADARADRRGGRRAPPRRSACATGRSTRSAA